MQRIEMNVTTGVTETISITGVELDARLAAQAEWAAGANDRKAAEVRAERDTKLSDTDWRFRSDMTPSQAWKDYCQALRDVPSQQGFPWTITWPDAP